jgi:SEC-C motif-containing protein
MRSRYTAWCLGREQYLLATWHPSTRPARLDLATGVAGRWIGLKVCRSEAGREADTQGSVEFVARFKLNGKAQRLHEVSRFVREGGRWYYIDGDTPPEKAGIKPAGLQSDK